MRRTLAFRRALLLVTTSVLQRSVAFADRLVRLGLASVLLDVDCLGVLLVVGLLLSDDVSSAVGMAFGVGSGEKTRLLLSLLPFRLLAVFISGGSDNREELELLSDDIDWHFQIDVVGYSRVSFLLSLAGDRRVTRSPFIMLLIL